MMFRLLLFAIISAVVAGKQPHIVLIVADDYGWNDVGYHNPDVYTPTLDKLAAGGVKLDNYYVQPICTPSRSQLLSGKYQIHTGLQHSIIWEGQPNGLPLEDATIADRLSALGYSTHMVGKWHLGYFKKDYIPTKRGFDSFFGYLTGSEDYYKHTRSFSYKGKHEVGLDLRDNEEPVFNNTEYSAYLFTRKAQQVIQAHDANKPLFLYLPYQSVHSPLEVPVQYEKRYQHIDNKARRKYLGMVSCMDEAIENVTQTLKDAGLWEDTLIVFSTDNGGQVKAGGNNYPLRGFKHTLWEGGMRGVGFVHGNMLKQKNVTSRELMHISDWYPTLVHLAGGQVNESMKLDGYDIWQTISSGEASPRKEILHNIDPLTKPVGERLYPDLFDNRIRAALRVGNWKLITGAPGNSSWVPPPTSHSLKFYNSTDDVEPTKNLWLFDLSTDPYEHNDLSATKPDVVKMMLTTMMTYNKTAVPCRYPPVDPNSAPSLHNGTFSWWM